MSRQVASDHLDQKQQQLLMHVGNHLFCWQIADKYDQQIHLFGFNLLWFAGYLKFDLKGLASHCKAKTTFTFHFSIFKAFDNVKKEK